MKDFLQQVKNGIEAQPYAKMMGFRAEEAGEGYAVISCEKRPELLQQTGIVHGGVVAALCEAAAGYAALTVLPEGQTPVGVEYKINFLRPVTADKVLAKATVVKPGRNLFVVEVDACNEGSDQVAAKMLLTCAVVSVR